MQSLLMINSMNIISKNTNNGNNRRNNGMNKLASISINLNQYFILL